MCGGRPVTFLDVASESIRGAEVDVDELSSWLKEEGELMSPIDLSLAHSVPLTLPNLERRHFDRFPVKARITNNGWTVLFSGKWECTRPYIYGGPLKEKYVFCMLHFHWAENDTKGSEHTADGQEFPLEMHVVYFKAKYKYYEEAVKHNDGVVFEVHLFYIQPDDNKHLNKIIRHIDSITKAGTSLDVEAVPLRCIFFPFTADYLMYAGKILARNGGHKVLWLISRRTSGISHRQMIGFRTLSGKDGRSLLKNIHYLYDIGNRRIYHVNMSQYLIGALYPYPRGFSKENNKLHIQFRKISVKCKLKNAGQDSYNKILREPDSPMTSQENKKESSDESDSVEIIERNEPEEMTEKNINKLILKENNTVLQNINTFGINESSNNSSFSEITELLQETISLCSNCKNIKKKSSIQPQFDKNIKTFEDNYQQRNMNPDSYADNLKIYQKNHNIQNSYNDFFNENKAFERIKNKEIINRNHNFNRCREPRPEEYYEVGKYQTNVLHSPQQIYCQTGIPFPSVNSSEKKRHINQGICHQRENYTSTYLHNKPQVFCPLHLHHIGIHNAPAEVYNDEFINEYILQDDLYTTPNYFPISSKVSANNLPIYVNVPSTNFSINQTPHIRQVHHTKNCKNEKTEYNIPEKNNLTEMKTMNVHSAQLKKKPDIISVGKRKPKKKSEDKTTKHITGKSSSPLNIKITSEVRARENVRKESLLVNILSTMKDSFTRPWRKSGPSSSHKTRRRK